jgi:predicted ATP-dependent endonuclease of OLD family
MIVTRLKLTNLRAIEAAEFRFQPGLNFIVGVNGVGKTSVLDALGVCLSAVTKRANGLRGRVESFTNDDIRAGTATLTIEYGVRPVPRARFERERDRWTQGNADLEPFCQVIVWWLEQRLARMTV